MPLKSSSHFGMILDKGGGHYGHDIVIGGAEAYTYRGVSIYLLQ